MAGPFKMKGSPMQRNYGIGSPVREINTPKGFGGKGYSNPQEGLHIQDYKPTIEGRHSEMLKKTTKQSSKVSQFLKSAKNTLTKVATHPVTKVLGKVAAAATVPLTLYDFYKSGQKHSGGKVNQNQKSIMEEGKKYQPPKKNQKINFNKGK